MLDEKSQAEVNVVSRSTRIIVFSLCAGIVAFGAFVLFVYGTRDDATAGLITYMSLVVAGVQAIVCVIVPRMIVVGHRQQIAAGTWKAQANALDATDTDAGKLAVVYRTTTIIGCALLEMAAFLALITYLMEGHVATLIAALLMLIGVALHVPLGDRVTVWVENQLQIIEDDRRFLR
jgi:hypothetical protein